MSETSNSGQDVRQALQQYNLAMDTLEKAESAVQEALKVVKSCAQSATVNVDGQFFQVRERKDKLYLCELNGKPKGRPKGSKNSKPRKDKASADVVATDSESAEALDFTPENTGEFPTEASENNNVAEESDFSVASDDALMKESA